MRYAGIAGKAPPARPERPLTRSAGFFARSVPGPPGARDARGWRARSRMRRAGVMG